MSIAATLVLTISSAGAAFALLTALLASVFKMRLWSATKVSCALWLPLVTAASFLLYTVFDWLAAHGHQQNIGIALVMFGLWGVTLVPGLIAGLVLLAAYHGLQGRSE